MKYRFKRSNTRRRLAAPGEKRKRLVLRGSNTLRVFRCRSLSINYKAENFGVFDEKELKKSPRRLFDSLACTWQRLKEKIKSRKHTQTEPRVSPITLLGVFFGVLSVSLLSALIVISAIFLKYNQAYTTVTVPDLISMNAEDALAMSTDIFEYTVIYKSNPEKAAGSVTAQSPLPNVTRKFYGADNKISITITVNTEQADFHLPCLEGMQLREALILLRSNGINAQIIREYSDTWESGSIFYCSVSEGTPLKSGDSLTLYASLGKEKQYFSVPSLIGKSEGTAIRLIESSGFLTGEIKYIASTAPAGTVVSQEPASGERLLENSKISFTVSGGIYYTD